MRPKGLIYIFEYIYLDTIKCYRNETIWPRHGWHRFCDIIVSDNTVDYFNGRLPAICRKQIMMAVVVGEGAAQILDGGKGFLWATGILLILCGRRQNTTALAVDE
jgi:hypothetical protein